MSPPPCPERRRAERWRREGPGGAGRTGGPGSVPGAALPHETPPRTFPVAAHKLSRPGKLRGGRGAGALTCCGRDPGAAPPGTGMLGGVGGHRGSAPCAPCPEFGEFPGVWTGQREGARVGSPMFAGAERSGAVRAAGTGGDSGLLPHQAGPAPPAVPEHSGVSRCGTPRCSVRAP